MVDVRNTLKVVAADVQDRGRMYYLVDDACEFIPEVKEFLDWKAATNRAPATLKAYCSRLFWYYNFLLQCHVNVFEATPADLTEFVLWLDNPYRSRTAISARNLTDPLTASSVNLILQVVGAFYHFLVRRGEISESPVRYVDTPRGKWQIERDLLAHTHPGRTGIQRMELKLKEPDRLPPTVSEQDFQTFINSIHMRKDPNGDPTGFRDRLLCLMLKEGGFRIGELLGIRMEDLEFGKQGIHIRFRPNNENGARAKVIAALRRQLGEMKQTLLAKEQELRQKQREIDKLYGKLAAASWLVDAEVRQLLTTTLERLALLEDQEASRKV